MKLKKTVVFDGGIRNPSQVLDDRTTTYTLLGYGPYKYRTVTRRGGMDMIVETGTLSPSDLSYYQRLGFEVISG